MKSKEINAELELGVRATTLLLSNLEEIIYRLKYVRRELEDLSEKAEEVVKRIQENGTPRSH